MVGQEGWTARRAARLAAFLLCLLLAAGFFLASGRLSASLPSQQAAARWEAGEERYAQVSLFLGPDEAYDRSRVNDMRGQVARKLADASITLSEDREGARLWIDAYSGGGELTASRGRLLEETDAIGVGGDFFQFHPLKLLDGYYFGPDEVMKDRVLIDHDLAFRLYGSKDAAGMDIWLLGKRCVVAGVFQREDGGATAAAYGERSKVIVPIELLEELLGEAKITTYEIVLPSPVSGFGYGIVKEILTGVSSQDAPAEGEEEPDLGNRELVENSGRFSLLARLRLAGEFGKRSMRTTEVAYPYWENAARATEDFASAYLYLSLLFAAVPAGMAAAFLWRKWKGRKHRLSDVREWAERGIDRWRERRWERKRQKEEGT